MNKAELKTEVIELFLQLYFQVVIFKDSYFLACSQFPN